MLSRIFFVIGGIAVGGYLLNILINPGDALPRNDRMGEWRQAKVRPECYGAVDALSAPGLPKLPSSQNRIDFGDFARIVEMTAALHCYVVTERQAVCEPNNRAWIVDYAGKYYGKMQTLVSAAERYGEAEVRLVRQALNSDKSRAITTAMEANIRDGRVIKADFGWSVPAPLQATFKKYPNPSTNTCPTTQTARK